MGEEEAAGDHEAEATPSLGAGSDADGDRDRAHDGSDSCHHDGTETDEAGLLDSL